MKSKVLLGALATAAVLGSAAVAAAPASATQAHQLPVTTSVRPMIEPGCDGDSAPPEGINTFVRLFTGNNACAQCNQYAFNFLSFPTYCWQTSDNGLTAELWIGSHLGG